MPVHTYVWFTYDLVFIKGLDLKGILSKYYKIGLYNNQDKICMCTNEKNFYD